MYARDQLGRRSAPFLGVMLLAIAVLPLPPNGDGLNGNPWIFVFQDGTWYAATWEWLRFGQTAKSMSSVAGDHIKKAPLQDFHPVSGHVYGFMVSGLARDAAPPRSATARTPSPSGCAPTSPRPRST